MSQFKVLLRNLPQTLISMARLLADIRIERLFGHKAKELTQQFCGLLPEK
jgi:hypothetical protein